MRKANFDISHELDEFLMVEKPLTATKRKANMDLEKLGPEMRQLEEQYVIYIFCSSRTILEHATPQIYDIRLHRTQAHVILPTQPTNNGDRSTW